MYNKFPINSLINNFNNHASLNSFTPIFSILKGDYTMAEKCLFDYNAMELIKNKDTVQYRLTQLEIEYKKQEAKLLLNTDFKELGLTNEKMRTVYVTNSLIDLKESIELHKNSLNIVNDLIKIRLKEVQNE